jgi:hypothetical protein
MPIFYMAGPPEMVKAPRTIVRKMGVNDDDIGTKEFTGY